MKASELLGMSESGTLEFKSSAALKDAFSIAREAVAFLNTGGGRIWIGVREAEGGQAVEFETVPDAVRACDRLREYLLEAIEPKPTQDELRVRVESLDDGRELLIVDIKRPKSGRQPFAVQKNGGRFFYLRVGPRLRVMTREEILGPRKAGRETGQSVSASRQLLARREELTEQRTPLVWVALAPETDLELDLQGDRMKEFLMNPASSGNRSRGWTFLNPYAEFVRKGDRVTLSDDKGPNLTVDRSGRIEFTAPLLYVWHGGAEHTIYPLALAERVVSIFRLAAVIHRAEANGQIAERGATSPTTFKAQRLKSARLKHGVAKRERNSNAHVLADTALIAARGWSLPSAAPGSVEHALRRGDVRIDQDDVVLDRPLVFGFSEIVDTPDRCAFRLLRRLYEELGLPESALPAEFDRREMRWTLTD